MNKRLFLLMVIFYLFSFSMISAVADKAPDDLLAGIYLEHAVELFGSGNYEEAYSLADISLMFFNTSSDALFIRGVSGRMSGVKDSSASDLSNAIIADKWKYFNEMTARAYLSKYMYQTGDIESAYINLLPFSNDLPNSSFSTEIFIRLALGLGKIVEALEAAENLLEAAPYDRYPQLIMAVYDHEWRLKAEKILISGDPSDYFSKDVVQLIIRDSSKCGFLVDYYKNRWGEDRFYRISTICNRTDMLGKLLEELYPENSVVDHKELIRVYNLLSDEKNKQLFLKQLGLIKLTINYDIDNNGFPDTEALYNMGNLISFSFNSNQNTNYAVEWKESSVRLEIKEMGKTITFSYKSYPNLIHVTVSDDKSQIEYQLVPYSLSLDIIKIPLDIIKDVPSILDNISLPDSSVLTAASAEKSVNNFDKGLESKYVWMGADESIENIFNSDGVRVIERHFMNSVLITVFRDLDSDGVFDTTYKYKDGLLQTVLFDVNNNGIPEYIEDYKNGFVRNWDFNEDGLVDSRERYENGIIYKELSTELNGDFDTIFEINGDIK